MLSTLRNRSAWYHNPLSIALAALPEFKISEERQSVTRLDTDRQGPRVSCWTGLLLQIPRMLVWRFAEQH